MGRMWARFLVCGAVVALSVGPGLAQEQPVVFVHGVGSSPETWADAAARLQARIQMTPERARVSWWQSLESQGDELQAALGGLPASTIAVGHSLGGIAAREWSRRRDLEGVITLGSPNRGAPIANHANEWLGFNYSLFESVGNAVYWLGRLSYDTWWWVPSAVEGALSWGGYVADFSVRHLLLELGVQFGVPFVQEIAVGSPYLDDLNGGNLGREAAQIPYRVGISNTASEYWRGGPFRLKNPEYGGELSLVTTAAAAALDYWGFRVFSQADPLDWEAQRVAFGLWDTAFWLWNFDEFWCRTTSDDRPLWSAHCLPNDGFVPTWSQFYPGALNVEVRGGPVHTQETTQFDDVLYTVLTSVARVPPRDSQQPPPEPPLPPPPLPLPDPDVPPPAPSGASDTLAPDGALSPGDSVISASGRFYLTYQWDGNLVLYRDDAVPLWHAHTEGTSAGRAVMQLDGNLVVYDVAGTPLWYSGTNGYDGARLVVQDDGNLVVYTVQGQAVWASGTSGG